MLSVKECRALHATWFFNNDIKMKLPKNGRNYKIFHLRSQSTLSSKVKYVKNHDNATICKFL